MAAKTKIKTGIYLYAIVAGPHAREKYGAMGIDKGSVYCITDGLVAAVVSNVPNERIRPERRNLAAHHEVLKKLMEESIPLPMSFGIIADGPKAIEKILSLNRNTFRRHLERVEGKVEMGLRIIWDVPNIFEFLVGTHPELRTLRDRLFRNDRQPSHDEKIELGRTFDRVLNENRTTHAESVMSILKPCCFEIKENRLRAEKEIVNLACLVGRNAEKEFEAGIFEAAKLFDNNYSFDFSGPFPPHSFVDIDLQM